MTKVQHSSHHLEMAVMNKHKIRELCSFLRVHDPSLFKYSASSDSFQRRAAPSTLMAKPSDLNAQSAKQIFLDEIIHGNMIHFYTTHGAVDYSELRGRIGFRARKVTGSARKFFALGATNPACRGRECAVMFKTTHGTAYGIIEDILMHPLSFQGEALQFWFTVVLLEVSSGSCALLRAKPSSNMELRLLHASQILLRKSILLMPAIPADRNHGFKCNIIHL